MKKEAFEELSPNLEDMKRNMLSAYDKGYKAGIADGNINTGTFEKKVNEAYNNGYKCGYDEGQKKDRAILCRMRSWVLLEGHLTAVFQMIAKAKMIRRMKNDTKIRD